MRKLDLNSMEKIEGSKFFGWTDWDCGKVIWVDAFHCGRQCTRTYHALFIRTKTEETFDVDFCITVD